MKSILSLCVVLALAVLGDSALVQPLARGNLTLGVISPGDRLLLNQNVYQPGRPNAIQYQDVRYVGTRYTRVSAVRAYEIGPTQYASIWVTTGGIGHNNVTVRVQSYRGRGYNCRIQIHGR